MTTIQSITGLLLLVPGTLLFLAADNLPLAIISLIGGFVLMSLSKLVDFQQAAYRRSLGLPVTGETLHLMMKNSPQYEVESEDFNVYPEGHKHYTLLRLEGELYVSARVFKNVMTRVESEYTFSFPGRKALILFRSPSIYKGAELFEYGEAAFVSISALGLESKFCGGRLLLNFASQARETDD